MTRTFDDKPAVRERTPLLVGLVGPSGGGKTFSALRLAAGIQRVSGGDVFVIDTEARRALHYAERFAFRHVPFAAPFGPLDYLAAVEHCVKRGAGVVVVDSQSHEHEGPGGVLEMHAAEVVRLSRGDDGRAEKVKFLAWQKPKSERRQFINALLQMPCNFIFCFRAKDKLKFVRGKDPESLGWMPIAGEEFVFEMTLKCLLLPGADGVPTWHPEHAAERQMCKLPEQFKALFADRRQLDEDTGQRLAEWAAGVPAAKPTGAPATDDPLPALLARFNDLRTPADVVALEAAFASDRSKLWKSLGRAGQERIKPLIDAAKKRPAAPADNPDTDEHGVPIGPPTDYHPGQLFDGSEGVPH